MKCKRNLKKEVKGSVLFTVVAVMAIMMVLVMAALVFSMDATKRSYYDYYESQATYTARSLVESTIESLRSDNGIDLSKEIIDEELKAEPGNIGKPPINLTINGAGTASTGPARLAGYGEVESLTIQLVAIDSKDSYQISTDGENGNGTGNGIYKITAKVKYYTGNAISYSQYVQGSAGNNIIPPVNDGVGGFITLGGYAGNESTGPSINGAAYVNVKFNISDYDGEGMAFLKNDGNFPALSGNGYFNSSVGSNSQAFFVFKKGEGMTVLGSLAFQNMTRFVSEYTPTDVDEAENSRSIPYIYVEDAFCTGAANGSGQITVGSASNPFNIFCGRFLANSQNECQGLHANIYCYASDLNYSNNTDATYFDVPDTSWSEFSQGQGTNPAGNIKGKKYLSLFKSRNNSELLSWAAGLSGVSSGGNFYSMGSVVIKQGQNTTVTIPGDMYVAQGLYIAPNVTLKVNGALRVGGTIVYGQGATLDAPGYVQGVNYDEDVNNDIRFPAGMSREDITGYELVGYDNNGNIQLKTAEADKVTAKNVVPTREYIRSLFYTDNSHYPDTPFVKNSVQKPPVDFEKGGFSEYVSDDLKKTRTLSGQEQSALASNVLDKDLLTDSKYSFATKTITDSCTISGNIEGGTFIYINPTEDEIWINLINVTFESSVTIIYQDNKYDDAGNFIGKKKINFFVPTNSHMLDEYDYDSEANKNSEYVAKYYDQMNGKITFKNLTIMPRAYYQSNKWDLYTLMDDHMEFYPNATLYMAQMFTPAGKTAVRESDKKTVDVYDIYIDITGNGQKITFQDQSTIIMHIIAPSATFQLANTNSLNKTITYNGEAASNAQTVCGSVNIGYSMQLQNKFSMLAMSLGKSGGDPGPGAEDKNYSWTPINGHALYE